MRLHRGRHDHRDERRQRHIVLGFAEHERFLAHLHIPNGVRVRGPCTPNNGKFVLRSHYTYTKNTKPPPKETRSRDDNILCMYVCMYVYLHIYSIHMHIVCTPVQATSTQSPPKMVARARGKMLQWRKVALHKGSDCRC